MSRKKLSAKDKGPAIEALFNFLEKALQEATPPMSIALEKHFGHDPFVMLISCLISLRARDTATYPVCLTLFAKVRTPHELLAMKTSDLENILHSVGFYHQKARILQEVCQQLITDFDGKVPSQRTQLLSIKHVGHKTAALVLCQAFNTPAVCVDVHVHRLSNYLGLCTTKTPEATEQALMKLLPKKDWCRINHLLVMLGQQPKVRREALLAEAQKVLAS